jgi:hypothetical protein
MAASRNIVVHHPAKRFGMSDGTKPVYTYTIHIEPAERLLNADYNGLRGREELGIEDLWQHTLDVEALEQELRAFHLKLIIASQDR